MELETEGFTGQSKQQRGEGKLKTRPKKDASTAASEKPTFPPFCPIEKAPLSQM